MRVPAVLVRWPPYNDAMTTFTGAIHPLAAIWPMLNSAELADLANDIAENGLSQPIIINGDGTLIDGRNRLAACESAGVDPLFVVRTFKDDAQVAVFISGANTLRRHLSTSQHAMGQALMLAAQVSNT